MGAVFRVSASLLPLLESTQVYFLYTGLLELEQAGEIELSWDAASRVEDYAIVTEVERLADGRSLRLCFDIHDRSYLFSEDELRASDVYFKRSHHPPDVEKLAPEFRQKVTPFGPIFGPGNRRAMLPLLAGWLRYGLKKPKGAKATLTRLINYLRLPQTRDFERSPEQDLPKRVILQTRLWTEAEVTGAPFAPEINEERVGVVRALREALGDRFIGGALPTPFARKAFPDVVCEWDTRRSAYLETLQTCGIGIYTKGLHYATAWKLGEYSAASMAVVASGLRDTFVEPFTAPRNFLEFNTPAECAEKCLHLLARWEEARAMSRANHEYYVQHLRPGKQMRRWIDQAFTSAS
ncbi:MAG TPA: hypothetical protein VGM54_05150 [Chthoniobacter sp.]|jgi:hypothetical protein